MVLIQEVKGFAGRTPKYAFLVNLEIYGAKRGIQRRLSDLVLVR